MIFNSIRATTTKKYFYHHNHYHQQTETSILSEIRIFLSPFSFSIFAIIKTNEFYLVKDRAAIIVITITNILVIYSARRRI